MTPSRLSFYILHFAFCIGLVQCASLPALAQLAPPNPQPVTRNAKPVIHLAAAEGSYSSAQLLDFTGRALDAEDGDISAALVWVSSLQGQIGTGAFFTRTLPAGTHVLTASVADRAGEIGSASLNLVITAPVLLLNWSANKNVFTARDKLIVTVVSISGTDPLAGVSVTFTVRTANGKTQSATLLTEASGRAVWSYSVNSKAGGVGTYTLSLTASKTGYPSASASGTFQVQ